MDALLCQLASRIGRPAFDAERAADALLRHPDVDIAVFPKLHLAGNTPSS